VTASTSAPVSRVITQTSIDDLRFGGSSVSHIQLGQTVSVHVSVDSDPTGGPLPEGENVTVSGAGASDCVATLDANGEGSCELTPSNGGDQDIHASFAQTSEFEASTATPVSLLVNRPPAFASTPVTEIGEGLPYEYTATATDADGHSLSFNAVTLPAWLGMTDNGDNTATLSGTPGLADVGDHDVVIEADDGFGGLTQDSFTVTVTENTLPEITSDPVTEVGVLQNYSYTITAVDADGDYISLSVNNAPSWLDFNQTVDDPGQAEAVLSGTPDTADEGSYAIDVIANDGRGADVVDSFTLQVHPNRPPEFDSAPIVQGGEGLAYEYEVVVTDPDGDEISLSKDPTGQPWLDFVQTVNEAGEARGVLTGSPEMGDAGNYSIVLNAEDERGETASQSFTLEIEDNHPPDFTSTPVTDAYEGIAYSYLVEADDIDGDELSFSMSTGPAWLSLNSASADTAELSGEPGSAHVGDHDVTLDVSDGRGGVTSQSFTVTVAANQSPTITSTPVTTAEEGVSYSYEVTATDPDGDSISLSAPSLPAWLSFNDNGDGTAQLAGTPGADDGGDHSVVLEADDGRGGIDQQSFTLHVEANQPPEFTSSPETQAREGDEYHYAVTAIDPDGGPVNLSAPTLPAWLSFSDNGDGSGELLGTAIAEAVGSHSVVIEAEDNRGGVTEQSFTIEVEANQPPEFTSSPETEVREGDDYHYVVAASDPEGGEITLSAPTLPSWLSFSDTGDGTGELSGQPGSDEVGSHEVVLEAEDERGGVAEQSFTVEVEGAEAPVFLSEPVREVAVDAAYVYDIEAEDPAGEALTIGADHLPDWLDLEDQGDGKARLSGTPGEEDEGDQDVQLYAENTSERRAEQAFTIQVTAPDGSPPNFTSTPVDWVIAGDDYHYEVTAEDPDGGSLSLEMESGPDWLTLIDHGDGTATLGGTPGTDDIGEHGVGLLVRDSEGLTSSQEFMLEVLDPDQLGLTLRLDAYPGSQPVGIPVQLHVEVEHEGVIAAQGVVLEATIEGDGLDFESDPELDDTCGIEESEGNKLTLRCELGEMSPGGFSDLLFETITSEMSDVYIDARLAAEDEAFLSADSRATLGLPGHQDEGMEPGLALDFAANRVGAADLTGNGRVDLVLAGGAGEPTRVLHNQGDAVFELAHELLPEANTVGLVLADLYGTGIPDIVLVNHHGPAAIFRVDSENELHHAEDLVLDGAQQGMVVDLVGDGWLDIFLTGDGHGGPWLFRNRAGAGFEPADAMDEPGTTALAHGDVTADGQSEVLVATADGEVIVYRSHGAVDDLGMMAVDFDLHSRIHAGAGITDLTVADMDGSGYPDVVVARQSVSDEASSEAPSNRVFANDGYGEFALAQNLGRVDSTSVQALDVTEDGRLDLLFGNRGGGHQVYGRASGEAQFSASGRLYRHAGAGPVVLADLDGNGGVDWISVRADGSGVDIHFSDEAPPTLKADLAVDAQFSHGLSRPGEPASVALSVFNHGPDVADDALLEIRAPDAVDVSAESTADCAVTESGLVCALGDIPAGDEIQLSFELGAARSGEYPVRFDVSSETDDPDIDNNRAEATWVVARQRSSSGGCQMGSNNAFLLMLLVLLAAGRLFGRRRMPH